MLRGLRRVLMAFVVGSLAACAPVRPPVHADPPERLFIIRALGNRCIDAGDPARLSEDAPVTIQACRDSASQRYRVLEIAEPAPVSHDFTLAIPDTSFCLGVSRVGVAPGAPLKAQPCTGSRRQRFAFDGDALLVGVQQDGARVSRDFVIEPRDANTNEGTPVVVGSREFSDAEYWRVTASDGSDARAHGGFVTAADYSELDRALDLARWGTVIEVTSDITLGGLWDDPEEEDPNGDNIVRSGVTLRGNRKFRDNGPEIVAPLSLFVGGGDAFRMENAARITGLRLRGPGGPRPPEGVTSHGIVMNQEAGPLTSVIVDHVEARDWSDSAFKVSGAYDADTYPNRVTCADGFHGMPISRLVGNFLHRNNYSILVDNGGYAFTARNHFFRSRHDVVAGRDAAIRYIVHDSIFTSESNGNEHMIDVHGTCSATGSHWRGGRAGDLFDVGWNTFINSKRGLLVLRGTPCKYLSFHDNVTTREEGSIELWLQPTSGPPCESAPQTPFVAGTPSTVIVKTNNEFEYPDPLRTSGPGELGVGDFDGDGVDDVFLGTGVTWWFSSGGKTEWRFLNRMAERAGALRFGDFDGDGRTDVVRIRGRLVEVSWAGGSPWNRLSLLPVSATIADVAVGQFDGDSRADLFLADGTQWRWASAGATWDFFAFSGYRVDNLRFGDFTEDGRTDVFGIESGRWRIVRGPGEHWEDLGPARSTEMNTLVVADFDGDKIADVGRSAMSALASVPSTWLISKSGRGTLERLRFAQIPQYLTALPIGRFDEQEGADVLFWDSLHFRIASGGKGSEMWSRQGMR